MHGLSIRGRGIKIQGPHVCSRGITTGGRVAGWVAGRKPSALGAIFGWIQEARRSKTPESEPGQGRAACRARHHEKAEQPALRAGLAALAARCNAPATGKQQAQQAHGGEHVHKGEQRGEPAAAVAAAVPLPAAAMPATAAASAAAAMTAASMEGAAIPATRAGGGSSLRAAPPSSSTWRRR